MTGWYVVGGLLLLVAAAFVFWAERKFDDFDHSMERFRWWR